MTVEKFNKAKEIEERIYHCDKVIDLLYKHRHELKPPTRMSSFTLAYHDTSIVLSEAEVEYLKLAMENHKKVLEREFEDL